MFSLNFSFEIDFAVIYYYYLFELSIVSLGELSLFCYYLYNLLG
jgi:hypothetical protein